MCKATIGKLPFVALLLGAVLALSACNTIGGLGDDINGLGKSVTKGAETTQKKM